MTTKLQALKDDLRSEESLIVGYSGGADSAFLAAVASEVLGPRMVAITGVSDSLKRSERTAAREFARQHAIPHVEVFTSEGDNPDYIANDGNRCYYCKSALFDALGPVARMMNATIAVGTNVDDLGDYRPGQRAATEDGVIAPLVDAGLTKREIRALSLEMGLETAAKPAAACLASRVAYGDPVTPEVLAQIELAETGLADIGFAVARVRSHGSGTVARIEVPEEAFDGVVAQRAKIDNLVRGAGFQFCSMDLLPYSTGRLNVLLKLGRKTS